MTIDKAIKILTALSKGRYSGEVKSARDAEKLGIEALRRLKRVRDGKPGYLLNLMLGETEK